MTARRKDERGRASTPLELLFDLTFVVAAGQIAVQLAHGIEAGHTASTLRTFLIVFFAIWWAWMNFTWFASGYDTDDVPYRLFTMMQMAGVLVLAAGVPAGFQDGDFRGITIGYLIMRVGLVAQWIRAARSDPEHRRVSVRTAVGFGVAQVGWLLLLGLPDEWALTGAVALAVVDMAVPLWAERAGGASWNPHHIAERYGLFAILLLGESILAATTAVEEALHLTGRKTALAVVAMSGLVLVFALWWLYYLQPAGRGLEEKRHLAYVWGYGHYGIFAALAALGAGLEVTVLRTGHRLASADWIISCAVAVPVGVFLLLLWAVHTPLVPGRGITGAVIVPAAVLVFLSPLATPLVAPTGVLLAVTGLSWAVVAVTVLGQARAYRLATHDAVICPMPASADRTTITGSPSSSTPPESTTPIRKHDPHSKGSPMTEPVKPVLEAPAQAFADANAKPPFLYQLSPEEGRKIAVTVQTDPPAHVADADVSDLEIKGGPTGTIRVRIVRPAGATGVLPVILYVHGLGWVFGGPETHDRLVRELAVGVNAAVVFPDYDLAPEAKYPTQIEQVYAVADWIAMNGPEQNLDSTRIAVAGDSVGGNMATVTTILAKQRGGVQFQGQLLYYPVTDAAFDTGSYHQFAEGYFLAREGMKWFWDQYTTDPAERAEITASPLRASTQELEGLPEALVIVAEADVLRDEGEAYAAKLRAAGVPVTAARYGGIIHDFVGLNPLRRTFAAEAAITQGIAFLRRVLGTDQ